MPSVSKKSFLITIIVFGVVALAWYAFAWTTPTADPPASNLPAPLNVSSDSQSKEGSLAVGTSTAPSFPLDVFGVLRVGNYSSAPSGANGAIYYDTSDNTFKGYQGGSWSTLGGGSSLWTANGSDIYYNDGNVGIATTTPNALLDIQKVGTSDLLNVSSDTNGDLLTIDNSGNVGIGTTSPGAKLQVYGSASRVKISDDSPATDGRGNVFLDLERGGAGKDRAVVAYNDGSTNKWNVGLSYNCGGYTPNFYISQKDYLNDCTNSYTPELTITTSGNVGIGTTSPGQKLEVNGNVRVDSDLQPNKFMGEDVEIVKRMYCYTTDTYTGNLGGIDGANAKCASACGSGYRFAAESDPNVSDGNIGWTIVGSENLLELVYNHCPKQGNRWVMNDGTSCNNWTNGTSDYNDGNYGESGDGCGHAGHKAYCSNSFPLQCYKKTTTVNY